MSTRRFSLANKNIKTEVIKEEDLDFIKLEETGSKGGKEVKKAKKSNNLNKKFQLGEYSVKRIEIDRLVINDKNLRKGYNEELIEKMAETIKQKGLIQPLIVEHNSFNNTFTIINGNTRYLAIKRINEQYEKEFNEKKFKQIPCIEKIFKDDLDRDVVQLISNNMLEKLNPFERADAIGRHFDKWITEAAKEFVKENKNIDPEDVIKNKDKRYSDIHGVVNKKIESSLYVTKDTRKNLMRVYEIPEEYRKGYLEAKNAALIKAGEKKTGDEITLREALNLAKKYEAEKYGRKKEKREKNIKTGLDVEEKKGRLYFKNNKTMIIISGKDLEIGFDYDKQELKNFIKESREYLDFLAKKYIE